jgi:hypothetical protein
MIFNAGDSSNRWALKSQHRSIKLACLTYRAFSPYFKTTDLSRKLFILEMM